METYSIDGLTITCEKQGADKYIKISYPFRYGKYLEIKSNNYTFQFNLNGEIKTIQGRGEGWLDASEWLKRNAGNDWTYFAAGGYTGAYDFTGEYYVPCLPYDSNGIFGHNRFNSPEVAHAFEAWHQLIDQLSKIDKTGMPRQANDFINRVRSMGPETLKQRAQLFHDIIGGQVSVLPPDTRHVEYDVIPLTIGDGCLYNCGFCRVKSGNSFKLREKENILNQIHQLKRLYDKDSLNYNSIFLGQHDALFAGAELIEFAAKKSYEILELKNSVIKNPKLFLFGSVDSILRADDPFLKILNKLPYETFINIGLESADPETLAQIEKPLNRKKITQAFHKMMEINKQYSNVEVSANFLYGADLPETHLPSILELTRNRLDHFHSKGTIYFSPLENIGAIQEVKNKFTDFKTLCRLPVYMYLIQRL
ncbi:MAG: hypothetical protein HF978_02125 [Desulfobacteraceae bacterium]|nr:hypothetical protein [Desulfobacteraceae bacterium]MBC2754322.1 hypothetical protein [Desulfobacteraceae bacterium]